MKTLPSGARGALGRAGGLLFVLLNAGCVIPISPGTGDGGASSSSSGGNPVTDAQPPAGNWVNSTNNLAGMNSECGNMSNLSAKPDEDMLIAGIALAGLFASRDGGGTWQPLGTGAGSAMISNRATTIAYDPQNSQRFWESGIYGNAGGVYETTDDGATFTQLGTVYKCDAVAVDTTDPARKTLLVGGHEQSQTLYRTTDSGMTWPNIGANLPPNTNCTLPVVVDAKTYLVGCGGYGGGQSGVYRSVDAGMNWMQATTSGGASPPLLAHDGSIYWASPNGVLARSTDHGQTWMDVVTQPNFLQRFSPTELPDGRIAALGQQYVMISDDHGVSWKPGSAALPYGDAIGVLYSAPHKAFFIWRFTCGDGSVPVPADAIMRFDFDYQKS